jgi:hypothetical protein
MAAAVSSRFAAFWPDLALPSIEMEDTGSKFLRVQAMTEAGSPCSSAMEEVFQLTP